MDFKKYSIWRCLLLLFRDSRGRIKDQSCHGGFRSTLLTQSLIYQLRKQFRYGLICHFFNNWNQIKNFGVFLLLFSFPKSGWSRWRSLSPGRISLEFHCSPWSSCRVKKWQKFSKEHISQQHNAKKLDIFWFGFWWFLIHLK